MFSVSDFLRTSLMEMFTEVHVYKSKSQTWFLWTVDFEVIN